MENGSFFGLDGPFFNVLNKIADLIILNVLWILCCIPVITIGASTTAMSYVTMKMLNGEDAYVARKFFHSFKENFLQSTIIWLILLAFGALFVCNYILFGHMSEDMNNTFYNILFSSSCLAFIIYAMIFVYVFPLQAKLENKIRHTFKNALLLSFRHLPSTIVMVVAVFGAMGLVLYTFYNLFFIWFLFAGSLISLLCSYLMNRIFAIYIKPESEEAETEENKIKEVASEENASDRVVITRDEMESGEANHVVMTKEDMEK